MSPEEAVDAIMSSTRPLTRAEVTMIVAELYEQGYDDGYADGAIENDS